jgi:DNA-binding response OmpR family regulator
MALKRNILIVDDESTILNFLKDGLTMYQDRLNVFTAAGVEEALGIVDAQRIDLITTDIRMPGADGFELISRSRKKNPDTRFIVMTAYSCEEYFEKSKNVGVIDYIRKPFDFEEFVERVFQALEASRGFWAARLDGFQITDALQLVHMVRRSQTIRVRTEFGEEGLIHLKDGEVVHAVLEELEGEEAFYEIVALEGGEIESLPLPEELSTTIQRPLAALILEGVRLKDEAASARKRRPRRPGKAPGIGGAANESLGPRSDGARERANPATEKHPVSSSGERESEAAAAAHFYRLMDDGFGFYRGGDLRAARERWEKAALLRPHDRAVQFNLRKLAEKEKDEDAVRPGSETLH